MNKNFVLLGVAIATVGLSSCAKNYVPTSESTSISPTSEPISSSSEMPISSSESTSAITSASITSETTATTASSATSTSETSQSTITTATTATSSTSGTSQSTAITVSSSETSATSPVTSSIQPTSSSSETRIVPSTSSVEPVIHINLKTPVLSVNNDTGKVSWSAVEHAGFYRYYINNGEFQITDQTSLNLSEGQSFAVMADSNDDNVTASSWSNPISFVKIDETYKYAKITFKDAPDMISISHPKGTSLSIKSTPKKLNYEFDGWYKDPFFKEAFIDGEVVDFDMILFAKWVPAAFLNANFFIKCNNHLSNNEKGYNEETPSQDSWGFIPLHYDPVSSASLGNRKAFTAIVNTDSSTTESSPAEYIVMDGVDDLAGRKYWKSADELNFTVKSQGTWKVTFSIEYEWDKSGQKVHAHLEGYSAQGAYSLSKYNSISVADLLETPNVTLNKSSSKASWASISGASKYQYSINNGEVLETNACEVNLYQGQYIVVRAMADSATLSSKWSQPVVYCYNEPIKSDFSYVTFFNSNVPSLKVNTGDFITDPGVPTKKGYLFDGWYSDVQLKNHFDFLKPITKNTVIYAKWNLIKDTNRYFLFSPSNVKVGELHLNEAQKSFNEYFGIFTVGDESGTYKIVDSLNNNKVLYTHLIDDTNAEYQVCFSFDHLYANNKFATINHTKYNLYFTNNLDASHAARAYYWNKNISSRKVEWPGTTMVYEKDNEYGEPIYSISLYKNYYTHIIFNNGGNGKQTVDISLEGVEDMTQWYCEGGVDSSGCYKVGTTTYK